MKIRLENLGTINANLVTINNLEIWFSYETPVSFYNHKTGKEATRKNNWGSTTGKLLNRIEPDKKKRIDREEFEKMLQKELNNI